jgi:regulator of RNase E activity RraA
MFPLKTTMAGYACTAKLICDTPPGGDEKKIDEKELLYYLDKAEKPSVMVIQNLDRHPADGGSIGDCMTAYFMALGCIGCVTNGGLRDAGEISGTGFHVFAAGPAVGYSHFRYVALDTAVNVGGLVIYPGDLIAGDVHGIIKIPADVCLDELIASMEECVAAEEKMKEYCRSADFCIEGLYKITGDLDHLRNPEKK